MDKELFKGIINRHPRQGTTEEPVEANVVVNATVDVPVIDMAAYVGKPSGGDFTTAYLAGTTITLGVLPDASALTADDILTVVQINAAGSVVATYRREDAAMSIAGGVLTVAGATFAASDIFVIYTNVQKPVEIDTTGLATQVTLAAILADTATMDASLTAIAAVDFATQTTLAALEAKDFATQTTLALIESKDFATQTTLAALEGKDFATQTTLAAILADTATMDSSLASIAAEDFATETTLATLNANVVTLLGYTDNIETTLTAIDGHVDGLEASMTTMVTAVHAVDSVAGATDGGFAALVKRKDALAGLTPADGDYTYLQVNNQGSLWVQVSGPINLNATMTDDSAFTIGGSSVFAMGAVADETGSDSVDEGDIGALRMTLTRFLKTSMGDLLAGEDQTNGLFQVAKKPLAVSTYAYSKDVSSALEASSIAKATAGNLFRAFGNIDKSAPSGLYYVLLLDSATLPADGAVTHVISPIPVNHVTGTESTFDTDEIEAGVASTAGIVIVLSSTMVTKTISSSYLFATVLYK